MSEKKKPCCRNCAYSEPNDFDDEVDCLIYSQYSLS